MTTRGKKNFLILSITLPFLFYCMYYYGIMVKNAPYKFSEFNYINFEYGISGDSLLNKYNSKTGDYQYVTQSHKVVKKHLNLNHDQLLYLHRKAADLGFWDFPANETVDSTVRVNGQKPPRYVMEFSYKRKTKRVIFDAAYEANEKLIDANQRLIKEIQKIIDEADAQQKK